MKKFISGFLGILFVVLLALVLRRYRKVFVGNSREELHSQTDVNSCISVRRIYKKLYLSASPVLLNFKPALCDN